MENVRNDWKVLSVIRSEIWCEVYVLGSISLGSELLDHHTKCC